MGRVKNRIKRSRRERILERDGHSCFYCGAQNNLTLDHVIPKAHAGTYGLEPKKAGRDENLIAACYDCNSDKADKDPLVFLGEKVQEGNEWSRRSDFLMLRIEALVA